MSQAEPPFDRLTAVRSLHDQLAASGFFAERFGLKIDEEADLRVFARRGGRPLLVRFISSDVIVVETVLMLRFPADLDPAEVSPDPQHHAATPHDTLPRVLNLLNHLSQGPRYSARFFDGDIGVVCASSLVTTLGLDAPYAGFLVGATIDRVVDRAMEDLEPFEHRVAQEKALNA